MKKLRVAVLYGGRSAEHEVSVASANNVIAAMDPRKYAVRRVFIDRKGCWQGSVEGADVVFPVLHGPYGEDGTVQGLLKLKGIPFVGSGVLGSAVGMDKDVMKRLLRDAKIPIAKFLVFGRADRRTIRFGQIRRTLGAPVFVKPANLGSSVGIHKVKNMAELRRAVTNAFKYDDKILIEEFVKGREIECSVLGNDRPLASLPGEVVPRHEFYSYDAKYVDDKGADLIIPTKLPAATIRRIQKVAVKAFKVLCAAGMARVDFFLTPNQKIVLNEINTIPGFTNISMFPKLWEASGLPTSKLIDRLIALAREPRVP